MILFGNILSKKSYKEVGRHTKCNNARGWLPSLQFIREVANTILINVKALLNVNHNPVLANLKKYSQKQKCENKEIVHFCD